MKKQISLALALTAITTTALADIQISGAYIRATPPGAANTAAFMTIRNTDTETVTMTSAESNAARSTELHTVIKAGEVMKMRQVDGIEIPAQGDLELRPGSYHVMFVGLDEAVNEGDDVALTLNFSDGSSQQLTLPAKKVIAGMQHQQHGKMNMQHPPQQGKMQMEHQQ